MHIIFGDEQADALKEKYTILELDTFKLGNHGPIITAYCAIDVVPFGELFDLGKLIAKHEVLIGSYKNRNWNTCIELLAELENKWAGELNTFYHDLQNRVTNYINQEPDSNWTPIIIKNTS